MRERPAWQLPAGVSRGTWDYIQSDAIARDYDRYFSADRLMALDEQFLGRFLPPSPATGSHEVPVVADFGCGTGRIARLLQPRGFRILNIDLSLPMLRCAGQELQGTDAVAHIHANLAQLDCLPDQSIDLGICLYSSLGMIRGREHRLSFLRAAHRCLKSKCHLILHVHNRYHGSYKSLQLAWLLKSRIRSWTHDDEFGDRSYGYRGLPKMFLHIFSRREILRDMRAASFHEIEIQPIDGTSSRLLPKRTKLVDLLAGGFFIVAQR